MKKDIHMLFVHSSWVWIEPMKNKQKTVMVGLPYTKLEFCRLGVEETKLVFVYGGKKVNQLF